MHLRSIQLCFAVLLAISLPTARALAESPPAVSLSYHLWEGGMHALSFETHLKRVGSSYRANYTARTEGLVGWLYPYKLKARSEGISGEDGLRPLRFQSTTRKPGKTRRREITYSTDGSLEVRLEPPRRSAKREEVPEALMLGTLDPASAVFALVEAFTKRGRCEGNIPVFDGKRRYNLVVSPAGQGALNPSRYGMYSGPATLCRVAVEPIAGFRKKKKKSKSRIPSEIKVWMAPVTEHRQAVPVRLEGKTKLGHIVLHLVAAEIESSVEQAKR